MSGLLLPRHVAVERAKQQASEAWDNRKIRVSVPQLPEGMEAKKAPDNDADDPNVEPIGDARAQHAALARAFEDAGKDVVQDADQAIPEGLPDPTAWRVVLMPVRQVIKQGSIFIPPETLDVQNWTHQLFKVCRVGNLVYRGPAWAGFSEEQLEAERPRVGDLYLVDPKAPRRYKYKGITFIVVNDDQLWSRVDPACIDGLEFKGLAL
jgi:hypothetical protein